jgi:hypothetical protein
MPMVPSGVLHVGFTELLVKVKVTPGQLVALPSNTISPKNEKTIQKMAFSSRPFIFCFMLTGQKYHDFLNFSAFPIFFTLKFGF